MVWTGSEYALVWEEDSPGPPTLHFARIDATGSPIGAPVTLAVTLGGVVDLSLVWNGDGFGLARSDGTLRFVRLDRSGNVVGLDTALTPAPPDFYFSPSLMWNGSGYAIAAERTGGTNAIVLFRLALDGSVVSGPTTISGPAAASPDRPTAAWTGSGYGVAWQDQRDGGNGSEVYFARADAAGQPLGPEVRVTNAPGISQPYAIAWSGATHAIVFEDARTGTTETYAAWLDGTGVKLGSDLRLASSRYGSQTPMIAWTGQGYGVAETDLVVTSQQRINFLRIGCDCPDGDHDGASACSDCNDANPAVFPGHEEICDALDNDCSGAVDDVAGLSVSCRVGLGVCQREGSRVCSADGSTTCSVSPGAPGVETCDGLDNDCDGAIDEDLFQPCSNACGAGQAICSFGQYVCTAAPCTDCTAGSGLQYPTPCAALAAGCTRIALGPGTWSIAGTCSLPGGAALVSLAGPQATTIIGSLSANGIWVEGLTIQGNLTTPGQCGSFVGNIVHGSIAIASGGECIGGGLVAFNSVDASIGIAGESLVWGNTAKGGISKGGRPRRFYAVGNDVSGGAIGISVTSGGILQDNAIHDAPVGIRVIPSITIGLSIDISGNDIRNAPSGIVIAGGSADQLRHASIVGNRIDGSLNFGIDLQGSAYSIPSSISQNLIDSGAAPPGPPTAVGLRVSGSAGIEANTVVDGAGGVLVAAPSYAQQVPLVVDLRSNIVGPNGGPGIRRTGLASVFSSRNDVFGNAPDWDGLDSASGLNGNIAQSPLFRDPASDDWSIDPASPCVDKGIDGTQALDLGGNPRKLDGDMDGVAIQDMGAYEAAPEVLDLNALTQPLRLEWPPNPYATSGFDIYSGPLSAVPASGFSTLAKETCSFPGTSYPMPGTPPVGNGKVYLVAPRGAVSGSLGHDSAGHPRTLADLCP